ncbi:MAG: HD domain-containing protein [Candidatus Nanopelagicales bacterium]
MRRWDVAKESIETEAEEVITPASLVHEMPRRRQLLNRLTGSSRTTVPELEPLLRTLRQFHPKANKLVVERAYVMAAHLHSEQKRRSGEPYITHPLAVATILAELGMTPTTLAAALLHDTVEDTGYTVERLREDFGDEVARLVDGVTKLDKVQYGDASAAETVRKMVVAMARDIRVLVIKLADRLHNMRTISWLPENKQQKKARETLEIYAPLGPPARDEHDQVGARGSGLRDLVPEDVRRDRAAGRTKGAVS